MTEVGTERVEHLDRVWSSIAALGDQLSEDEWKRPSPCPGWSVQDLVSHLIGIESMLLGRDQPAHEAPPGDHLKNDIARQNEIAVDYRRRRPGTEVLGEFREVAAARLAQLRGIDAAGFEADSWTPAGPGTVADLLGFRVFDSWVHEQDMRHALDRPGHLEGPVAEAGLVRTLGVLPRQIVKAAGAPEGTTVVVQLDGPLARSFAVAVEGGRGHLRDEGDLGGPATVRLAMDTPTFLQLSWGRTTADAADVTVQGDDTLGRRIVESMNFLF